MPFDSEHYSLNTAIAKYTAQQTMTMIRIIERMLKVFGENGEHWTKYKLALMRDGRECEVESEDAFAYCFVGGIRRAHGSVLEHSLCDLAQTVLHRDVVSFNDDGRTTYEEVRALLRTLHKILTLHRERLTQCQTLSSHQLRGPIYSEPYTTS